MRRDDAKDLHILLVIQENDYDLLSVGATALAMWWKHTVPVKGKVYVTVPVTFNWSAIVRCSV